MKVPPMQGAINMSPALYLYVCVQNQSWQYFLMQSYDV